MKILQVSNSFKYAWEAGGVTRVAYEISRCLANRGHEVTVFATEKGLPKNIKVERNHPVEVDGIEVYYFSNASDYLAQRAISIPYRAPSIIRKRLKEFDVIHLHEYRRIITPFIHHYAKKYGVPYVLQAHGSLTTFFYKGWLKRIFDKLWGYRILRDAAKVIALHQTEAEQYKSMGVSEDKIEIVPNGVDLSEFENLPQRGGFRRKYGLDDNERIVLYLGRIHQIKGLDLLARAFADLSKSLNDIKLVIVGPDGGYLPALKKIVGELKIDDKVLFTGPLYGQDKLEAYVDADIYVLPSFYETFPNTVLEACACGTPVILTNRCGIADVINGQVGLVVPYDKDTLGKAIFHVLSDNQLRQHFKQQSQSLIHQHFTWHKIVGRVEKIYQSAVNSPWHLE